MQILILRPGTYNDTQGRARRCAAGDVLETTRDYGASLIAAGYARVPDAAPPEAAPIPPTRLETAAQAAPRAKTKRRSKA